MNYLTRHRHGFISDKQPVQTVARRILSAEMSINYDHWAMEWSSSARNGGKMKQLKKGKGGAKQGRGRTKKSQPEEEEAEEVEDVESDE